MVDLKQIAASLATPSLASALQQAPELAAGQKIEAKIAQILSDGLIKLTSSFGTFELRASHPSLQPGVTVRLDVAENGNVTLTVLPQKTGTAPATQPAPSQPASSNPATITTLGTLPAPAPPVTYSVSGQTVQAPQENPQNAVSQTPTVAVTPDVAATSQTVAPAVSAALHEALVSQNSIAPLLANLDKLTKLSKPLPQSLQAAIDDVLQTVQPLSEEVTSQALQQAVKRSGVFLEHNLAQAVADDPPSIALAPKLDLKAALLKLVDVLQILSADKSPATKQNIPSIDARPSPPYGHDAPELQVRRDASLSVQSTQQEIAELLTTQAESALSRVRVLQFASMPAGAPDVQQVRPSQIWHLDIPLLINGQGAVIPMQIEREASSREAAQQAHRWRVRFAIDLAELGPVHALLALGGGMVDVTLWAEYEQTYALFKNLVKDLHYGLMDEDIDVAEIELRNGSPRAAARAGSQLDTRT